MASFPHAEVERVAPESIPDVELGMEALASMPDVETTQGALDSLVSRYREWIEAQRAGLEQTLSTRRLETALELLRRASLAADRIEAGIALLEQPDVFDAISASRTGPWPQRVGGVRPLSAALHPKRSTLPNGDHSSWRVHCL